MSKTRSARVLAALLLALAIWGAAERRPTPEQAAPVPQLAADPGGSSTGNGG